MKDIIKQSIIGALYMFAACTFMATLVIALYTLAGKQYGTGGGTGGRPPVYRRHIYRVGTHARSSPSGVIYVGKGLRYLTRATITITPRQSISLYPQILNRQIYTNILFYTRPPKWIRFSLQAKFSKIRKRKRRDLKKKFGYRKGYTYIHVIIIMIIKVIDKNTFL